MGDRPAHHLFSRPRPRRHIRGVPRLEDRRQPDPEPLAHHVARTTPSIIALPLLPRPLCVRRDADPLVVRHRPFRCRGLLRNVFLRASGQADDHHEFGQHRVSEGSVPVPHVRVRLGRPGTSSRFSFVISVSVCFSCGHHLVVSNVC